MKGNEASLDIKRTKHRHSGLMIMTIIIFILGSIGIISTIIFLFLGVSFSRSSINITKVIITDDPNQQASKIIFSSDTDIIYGIVHLDTMQPVPIKVRWHYLDGNILFHEDTRKIEAQGEWYISPPQGGKFTPGKYRFEVLLVDDPVKAVNFEIK